MKMNKNEITLKKLHGLVVKDNNKYEDSESIVASINAEFMQLGFVLGHTLFLILRTWKDKKLAAFLNEIIPILENMKGSDVVYEPMYPNFPKQVIEASDFELYMNALLHYWNYGEWKPDYDKLPRKFHYENVKFITLKWLNEKDYKNIFTEILSSKDSISEYDKCIIKHFLNHEKELIFPNEISFKENMCFVAAHILRKGSIGYSKFTDIHIKTTTDVLRVITCLSDGDVSLSENTKFKSLPRRLRKTLVKLLNKVVSSEDLQRHRNKWIRALHSLHVGDYCNKKLWEKVKNLREGIKSPTFNSKVEKYIKNKDITRVVKELLNRPGEFARRLDHILRLCKTIKIQKEVLTNFCKVCDKVPTRNLLQLLGHLKIRKSVVKKRVVFPKGSTQKAYLLKTELKKLSANVIKPLINDIENSLITRFIGGTDLGKVYIDSSLKQCPLPTQQRSASESLFTVARGTRLPFSKEDKDKNTLRFFIYWVGQDIDLSASLHDADFKIIEEITFYNLKSNGYQAYHSGDITNAPNGACEFIDITIDKAVEEGARYVVMNVYVYTGPNFNEHDTCYAGWMLRKKQQSNEIFDPKTVIQKADLTCASKNAIPVIFDLIKRQAIWTDLAFSGHFNDTAEWGASCNTVANNRATITQTLESITNLNNKMTLYDLFSLHAKARSSGIVRSPKKADTIFGLEGDVTPYDINKINSEFLI